MILMIREMLMLILNCKNDKVAGNDGDHFGMIRMMAIYR